MGGEEVDWTTDWTTIYTNSNRTVTVRDIATNYTFYCVCTQKCHYDKTK